MAIAPKMLESCALTEDNVTALRDATVLLTQYFFDAVNDLSRGTPIEDTWMAEYLPARYRALYDETFGRNFLTCLLSVSANLWDRPACRPACVGEHLAFHALLDFAQATLEDRGVEADFGPLWDLAYDDHGIRTLFELSHPVDPRLEFPSGSARSRTKTWCTHPFGFAIGCAPGSRDGSARPQAGTHG